MKKFFLFVALFTFGSAHSGLKIKRTKPISLKSVKMGKELLCKEKTKLKRLTKKYRIKLNYLGWAKKKPYYLHRPQQEYVYRVKKAADELLKTVNELEIFYKKINIFSEDIEREIFKLKAPIRKI